MFPTILIVDDELSIVKSLSGLLTDEGFREILEREYDRAELERRIQDAQKFVDILKDPDRERRLKVVDGILHENYEQAISHLQGVKNKLALQDIVLEAYRSAMRKSETDSKMLQQAFLYALYGGFGEGDFKQYLEKAATALIEYHLTKPVTTDQD